MARLHILECLHESRLQNVLVRVPFSRLSVFKVCRQLMRPFVLLYLCFQTEAVLAKFYTKLSAINIFLPLSSWLYNIFADSITNDVKGTFERLVSKQNY